MEFVLQGKKGNGKGIIACHLIRKYLEAGKPVATNMNIYLEHMFPPESKTYVYRLPDQPSPDDMEALGQNPTGGDEAKNGLIVLDECASWLNSREFRDKDRHRLIDWFLHSRKLGWDVVYIIQSINMLDKQFRDGFAEHLVNAQRLDRLPIPFVGPFLRFIGFAGRLPKIHVGVVRYGCSAQAPVVERIYARGNRYYKAYDTTQRFTPFNEFGGLSCTLPAYHVYGRYHSRWQMYKKIVASSLFSGIFAGALFAYIAMTSMGYSKAAPQSLVPNEPVKIVGHTIHGGNLIAVLPDGKTVSTKVFRLDADGVSFAVNGQRYYGELK